MEFVGFIYLSGNAHLFNNKQIGITAEVLVIKLTNFILYKVKYTPQNLNLNSKIDKI